MSLLALTVLASSCQEEISSEIVMENDPTLTRLLKMGYERSEIVDKGDYYLVQEDIRFKKEIEITAPRSQSKFSSLVEKGRQDLITVRIDGSIPTSASSNWRNAISEAINEWNTVSDCMLHMQLVPSSQNADITMKSDNGSLSAITAGEADSPSTSGAPGSYVVVNIDYFSNYQQRKWIMAHELGHTIGLRHTDHNIDIIPGTPSLEANSIMNSGGNNIILWNPNGPFNFTYYDRLAVQVLYPELEDEYLVSKSSSGAFLSIRRGNALHHDINMDGNINAVQHFGLGNSEDEYIAADWSGNGQSTIALRRNNAFHIDKNGDLVVDLVHYFGFGNSEDEYLLADWNGDGKETIAIRRGNAFHIDTTGDGQVNVVHYFGNGNAEDQYLTGDWNGNGKSTLAIRRGNAFHIDTTGDGNVNVIHYFGNGNSEDDYLSGDWNGDGKNTLAIRRDNAFHIDSTGDGYVNFVHVLGYGTEL